MTGQSQVSRFHEHSLIGISASVGAATLAGLLCAVLGAPTVVQGTVTAGAAGVPAAIEYAVRSKRRDKVTDAALIQQGKLQRPINLVVTMYVAVTAVGLFLAETVLGFVFMAFARATDMGPVGQFLLGCIATVIVGAGGFFLSSYTSHYLGTHPYVWIAVGVAIALVLRWVQVIAEFGINSARIPGAVILYGIFLGFCHAGAWYGLRHHDEFLARKLARMRRSAARAAATQQLLVTLDNSGPDQLPAPNPRDRRLE